MTTITASGLGSGLDITSIVEQLVEVETSPQEELLQEKEDRLDTELSAFGTLKSALDTLQSSIEELADMDSFAVYSATSSEDDIFTASASSSVTAGSYTVEVLRLAQNHKLSSTLVESGTTIGGTAGDSLDISINGETLSLALDDAMTIKEIAQAINAAEDNPGVTATVVNADDGSQGLVLTSNDSGYENHMELSYGGTLSAASFGFATSNTDAEGNTLTDLTELDASLVFDGYEITRSSNTIDDIIDGLTLNLEGAEPGTEETLLIEPDVDAVVDNIQAFVDAYNSAMDTISSLTDYDADSDTAGDLNGDSTVRLIQTQLRSILASSVDDTNGDYNMLWQVGIEFDSDGVMSIDTDDLEDALEGDFESVTNMFASDNGLAVQLEAKLDVYLEADGIIEIRTDSINDQLEDVEDDWLTLEYRTEQLYNRYLEQYTALDTLIADLNTTSDYLTSALANL